MMSGRSAGHSWTDFPTSSPGCSPLACSSLPSEEGVGPVGVRGEQHHGGIAGDRAQQRVALAPLLLRAQQPLGRRFLLGDVLREAKQPDDSVVLIERSFVHRAQHAHGSVRPDDPETGLRWARPSRDGPIIRQGTLPIRGAHPVHERLEGRVGLARVEPQDAVQLLGPRQRVRRRVPLPVTHVRHLLRAGQTGRGLPHGLPRGALGRDVDSHLDRARHRALGIADRAEVAVVDSASALAPHFGAELLAGQRPAPQRDDFRPVCHPLMDGLPHEFPGPQPRGLQPLAVEDGVGPVGVGGDQRHGRVSDDHAQQRVARAPLLLRAQQPLGRRFLLGDVLREATQPDDIVVLIERGFVLRAQHAHGSVRPDDPETGLRWACPSRDGPISRQGTLPICGVHPVHKRLEARVGRPRIEPQDAVQLLGPRERVRRRVPLPVTHARHLLRAGQTGRGLPQGLPRRALGRDIDPHGDRARHRPWVSRIGKRWSS